MKALGTYFQNDPDRPLVYGEVELINPPRQRLRGEAAKRACWWSRSSWASAARITS